jgi:hypothetical protein
MVHSNSRKGLLDRRVGRAMGGMGLEIDGNEINIGWGMRHISAFEGRETN